MKNLTVTILIFLVTCCYVTTSYSKVIGYKNTAELPPPPGGEIYTDVFAGLSLNGNNVFVKRFTNFKTLTGKNIGRVYFSNNQLNRPIILPGKKFRLLLNRISSNTIMIKN